MVWALLARPSVRAFSLNGGRRALRISQALQTGPLFSTTADLDEINEKIKIKGDEIRQLKLDGIEKADLAPHIAELLALKAQLPEEEKTEAPKPQKKKPQKQPKKKQPATKKQEEMSESELRLNRLAKVDAMRDAGVEPFEYSFQATHSAAQLLTLYDGKLEGGQEDEAVDVSVAGRIMTRRVFGKLAFFTMLDESGTIQLQFDKNRLGDTFKVRILLAIASLQLNVDANLHPQCSAYYLFVLCSI